MGDPVTTGMIIGAVGGAATSDNPIEGAMMGGAMGAAGGGLGGSLMGAGAGGAGGGFAGGGFGSVGPSGFSALSGAGGAGGGMFSGMSMPSTITGLGKDISAFNTFMNQNPVASRLGMDVAGSLMQGPAPIQMPGGMPVSRGQIQPTDFMSLLSPQQSQVIRPQSISLLG